jgi:hypothetical protein
MKFWLLAPGFLLLREQNSRYDPNNGLTPDFVHIAFPKNHGISYQFTNSLVPRATLHDRADAPM